MEANIQFRIFPSQRDCLIKCTPRHKQRGTRYYSSLKRPNYPSVDSGRQTQVIRVNNQLFQGAETRAARISEWPEWRRRDFGENNRRRIARS